MEDTTAFKIYNASAGSGKTFTLVKEYLKTILNSQKEDSYKNLLAITFTNKAVAEMKQRIIDCLVLFASEEIIPHPSEMLLQISSEINKTPQEIQLQAKRITRHLLYHYAGFSVETIDHFNHRLIRSFARDLKLPSNFEVSLDGPELLAEAVDKLISKAGEDKSITKVLVDFALEKTDDDKSWDIAKDLAKTASLLLNENDAPHITKLSDKKLEDFITFKSHLSRKKEDISEKLKESGQEALQLIEEAGLEKSDFNRGLFPNYLIKLSNKDFKIKFESAWQENFGDSPLYTKTTAKKNPQIAETIDELTPRFTKCFERTKAQIFQISLLSSILKNITPLSAINLVNQELEVIKEERNILPISEFNTLINNEIKGQPAPFIYERLGEKYRHFFIDEFQDTSLMQWKNLSPLIDNALSQQFQDGTYGSLLLVGDAKQSIYRWRGGLPEQFIELYGEAEPFSIKKKVKNLETNFRSHQEIINFNNAFFSHVSTYFSDAQHQELFKIGNQQKTNHKEQGLVQFEFIETTNRDEAHELYAQQVHKTILEILDNGYMENDICILTRTKNEGIALSTFLMEQGVAVVSSETLLLQYSPLVRCIVDTLTYDLYPENDEVKLSLIDFLFHHLELTEDKHSFYLALLPLNPSQFSQKLEEYGISVDYKAFSSHSLYETCEYIIRGFKLFSKADAYLYSFMDLVLSFEQQPQASKLAFLNYWETKKGSENIKTTEANNGIQLLTIHKAKGLEFPIVLFPYADVDLYRELNPKAWFPWDKEGGNFEEVLINYNKDVRHYSEIGTQLTQSRNSTLELDNINLLYVALTRAIEQLYVFAEVPKSFKDRPTTYNQLFAEYLKSVDQWEDNIATYKFGSSTKIHQNEPKKKSKLVHPYYHSTSLKDNQIKIVSSDAHLWGNNTAQAILEGNLMHDTMAKIKYKHDVESVFVDLERRAVIPTEELVTLRKRVHSIVEHPDLSYLFSPSEKIMNEREIITAQGAELRPDRINIHPDGSASIIDYKTGAPSEFHESQVSGYAAALMDMGYRISTKLLIYINDEGVLINKV